MQPVKRSILKAARDPITIITLMGVSGCGKTTIGKSLADKLGWEFIESDTYHSEDHIKKMANGLPLTDKDRLPWLEQLHSLLVKKQVDNMPVILACSALNNSYREILHDGLRGCAFVFLKGEYSLILERMCKREHFMKPSMLESQFKALEKPKNALVIPISKPVDQFVQDIIRHYGIG